MRRASSARGTELGFSVWLPAWDVRSSRTRSEGEGVTLIDRFRRDIQDRLEQLLSEAGKLQRALLALDPRASSPPPPVPRSQTRGEAPRAASTRTASSATPRARGQTKTVVLDGLAKSGASMTAGELAALTGLGRGTVSTTLSKLAQTGEVLKAERGYRLPDPAGGTSAPAGE